MVNQFLESGKLYSFLSRPKVQTIQPSVSVSLKPGLIPVQNIFRKTDGVQNYQNTDFSLQRKMMVDRSKDIYAPPFLSINPVLQNTGLTQYTRAPIIRRDRII